jgi:hypothetical protein
MTNVTIPFNLNSAHTQNEGEVFEEKFTSKSTGEDISFPKVRTAMVERGVESITFEVDFKKLNTKIAYYETNAEKR